MNEDAAGVDLLGSELMGVASLSVYLVLFYNCVLARTHIPGCPPPPKSSKYREGTGFFYQDGVCIG